MNVLAFMFIYLPILNSTMNTLTGYWSLHSTTVNDCPESLDSYSFVGHDQNCFYEGDVYVCKDTYWTFDEDTDMVTSTFARIPETGVVLSSHKFSHYGIRGSTLTVCDTLDQHCSTMPFEMIGDTLKITNNEKCHIELTFIRVSNTPED